MKYGLESEDTEDSENNPKDEWSLDTILNGKFLKTETTLTLIFKTRFNGFFDIFSYNGIFLL